MIGKMIPFAMVGLVDLILVTTGAVLLFEVPLRGSLPLLLVSALLFLMSSLGVGSSSRRSPKRSSRP
jgi:ABC-2 type transport system permease protein